MHWFDNPLETTMNPDSVIFYLGDAFRWSLMGDNDGEENDEDSIINDLDSRFAHFNGQFPGLHFNPLVNCRGEPDQP
jgi:hypothetical protein